MKILVTPTSLGPESGLEAMKRLREFADEIVYNEKGRPLTEEELIKALEGCDGYLAGLDQVSGRVLREAKGLKAVSRYGAGCDRVDLETARELGIPVANTPGANAEAVGELAFAMMLALARELPRLDASTKKGGWLRSMGTELSGKTLGIVGLGAIGRVVARCASGFQMRVIAYDPFINADYCREHGIEALSFEELISQADFISLHLPLTEETRHLVDRRAFEQMKDGVILIYASRGGIVDEKAARSALDTGRLGGLGLDAFEEEPPAGSPLFDCENVIATPHTGAHTREAAGKMAQMAVENLIQMLTGEACPHLVR